jgi:glycosyltransferase involved in cell wall biosynthesis
MERSGAAVQRVQGSLDQDTLAKQGCTNLCVVVPAYNEGPVIEGVLAGLRSLPCHIIVVDDGSSDGTAAKALAAGATVLRHVVNMGQGAALQTGIQYCLRQQASHVCTFDADGQHSVESLEALLKVLLETRSDIVIGSRAGGGAVNMPRVKRLTLKLALWFTRWDCGLPITDTHNGLRVMTRAAAEKIRIQQCGMAHASEILTQIRVHRLKFTEAPVTITYTDYSIRKGQSVFNSIAILKDLFYTRWTK